MSNSIMPIFFRYDAVLFNERIYVNKMVETAKGFVQEEACDSSERHINKQYSADTWRRDIRISLCMYMLSVC